MATRPFLAVSVDSRAVRIPKGQAGGGRYTTAQSAFNARNRELAERLQAEVVTTIQSRITRRAASTNRLIKATADRRNVVVTADHVGVGIESFLSKSQAKYWRTIEEGSAAVWKRPFIGTQLYPKGPGKAPFPVAHGMAPGLRTFSGKRLPWMNGERYVVKREIAPMHAYRDAQAKIDPLRQASTSVRKYLDDIAGLPTIGEV